MSESISQPRSRMVTGLFPDRTSAETAYQAVTERGYSRDDVNLVMSDEARRRHFADAGGSGTELGTRAAQGAGIGGAIGGSLGAIVAAIAAVGTALVVPGLGLVVAGPLAAAIAGAGAGGATGGIIGALIGYGIPEERVKHYEEGIRNGGILMGVAPRSHADAMHFENRWKESKGEHVIGAGTAGRGSARTIDPHAEDAHWRASHRQEPYFSAGYTYDDYAPAYRLGYDSRVHSDQTFEASESLLATQWDAVKGASRLTWAQARDATRAAWNRAS